MGRFSKRSVVFGALAIVFVRVLWNLNERYSNKINFRKKTTYRRISKDQQDPVKSTGKPIVPLSVLKSWSAIYGEKGCPKNPWRGRLRKLFKSWRTIAKKYNIEYVLTYGTLFGALRTGDVIPYDSDMDVFVNFKYYPLLKNISVERNFDPGDSKVRLVLQPEFERNISTEARKRYTCEGKLSDTMVDACSFQDPMGRLVRRHLHIDLWPLYDRGDKLLDTADGDIHIYTKKDMFPLRLCKMMGCDSYCPNKPWNILKAHYRTSDLEPTYKCKGKKWLDKNNQPAK